RWHLELVGGVPLRAGAPWVFVRKAPWRHPTAITGPEFPSSVSFRFFAPGSMTSNRIYQTPLPTPALPAHATHIAPHNTTQKAPAEDIKNPAGPATAVSDTTATAGKPF